MALDATDRKICTTRRIRTNTPVASFVTLNDPAFVETAVATANRIVQSSVDNSARIQFAYQLIVGRTPNEKEFAVLEQLVQQQYDHYKSNAPEATKLLAYHQPLAKKQGDEALELAAWTIVANTLLNLDEVLTRN